MPFYLWPVAPGFLAILGLALSAAVIGRAQGQNPTSAVNPFWGSVTAEPVNDAVLKLSLDDAVRRGLSNNLGLREAESAELSLHGEKNQVTQIFVPTITLNGNTGYYMHDLAALGFGPDTIGKFSSLFPGGKPPAGLSLITRDDLTDGQIQLTQVLFSAPAIAAFKAAGAAERSAYFGKMTARGEVVQQVATAYLRAIADASQVENEKALVAQAQVFQDHAHEAHAAGTAAIRN